MKYDVQLLVLDVLQKMDETRANILKPGVFTDDEVIDLDNKLEIAKIELNKLLTPIELNDAELDLIMENAKNIVTTVHMPIHLIWLKRELHNKKKNLD
jgi:hypothetical protein